MINSKVIIIDQFTEHIINSCNLQGYSLEGIIFAPNFEIDICPLVFVLNEGDIQV